MDYVTSLPAWAHVLIWPMAGLLLLNVATGYKPTAGRAILIAAASAVVANIVWQLAQDEALSSAMKPRHIGGLLTVLAVASHVANLPRPVALVLLCLAMVVTNSAARLSQSLSP